MDVKELVLTIGAENARLVADYIEALPAHQRLFADDYLRSAIPAPFAHSGRGEYCGDPYSGIGCTVQGCPHDPSWWPFGTPPEDYLTKEQE